MKYLGYRADDGKVITIEPVIIEDVSDIFDLPYLSRLMGKQVIRVERLEDKDGQCWTHTVIEGDE